MKTLYTLVIFFLSLSVALSQSDGSLFKDIFPDGNSVEFIVLSNDYVVETVNVYSLADGDSRHFYEYNSNSQMLSDLTENLYNGQWVKFHRSIFSYENNDETIVTLSERWRFDQWVNDWRITYTYDSEGNQMSRLREKFIEDRWVNEWFYSYEYDSEGNLIIFLKKSWESGKWANNQKHSYTYDDDMNILEKLIENWDYSGWANYFISNYSYDDELNNMVIINRYWIDSEKLWINWERETYTYDKNGNILSRLFEYFESEQWTKSMVYTYTYDEYGNLISDLFELGYSGKKDSLRRSYTYDDDGNFIKGLSEKTVNEEWVEFDRGFSFEGFNGNEYSFSNCFKIEVNTQYTSVENKSDDNFSLINAFPNPFSQLTIINFQLTIPDRVVLKIYDALGAEVAMLVNEYRSAGSHKSVFNAANHPTGMYYYTVQIGERYQNGKLILVR